MWIVIFLGVWLLASLIVSPVIGRFIVAHLKINEDAETLHTPARDASLERKAPSVAMLEPGKGKARLTLN
jgi:hypothetical protein